MCCRYGYEPGVIEEFGFEMQHVGTDVKNYPASDVHPSDPAVVIKTALDASAVCVCIMPWGFCSPDRKLLINARAESVFEKKRFSDSIWHRRCIVPARKFYEWDRNKVKNTFFLPGGDAIYMAGFYDLNDNTDRFIILTTAANQSMEPVHDRMPVIMTKEMARDWLFDGSCVRSILMETPPVLNRHSDYEQLSFLDMDI